MNTCPPPPKHFTITCFRCAGETYGDMADTEHAAQMLMGISGQSVPSTVSQQSDTQFVVGKLLQLRR